MPDSAGREGIGAFGRRARLGVNIDHVATLRNARGVAYPDPVRAALLAIAAGADGITAHLREDRRHIRDGDITRLMAAIDRPLNFEMAVTDEMIAIAIANRPHAACLVPERREEVTTEGGLDVAGQANRVRDAVARLGDAGIRVSLFIDPEPVQVEAATRVGAPVVELHTGAYCEMVEVGDEAGAARELARLAASAKESHTAGIEVHAGHGITFASVGPVAAIPEFAELNIGHFLVGEAVFQGLGGAIAEMLCQMELARLAGGVGGAGR
ncbi:MAG: pyridoxine 5'-phosphate synthase [Rhizobiales bacterium]|nr:pyridoxine 5'-phosphate synthase [Hyphomicrobiales bacterium]